MKKFSKKSLKKKLNIAIVAQVVNVNSGARAPIELARALAVRNNVWFFSYPYNFDKSAAVYLARSQIKLKALPYRETNLIGKLKNTVSLAAQLKNGSFDVISSHCLLPLFLATVFSGKPVVSTYYGLQKAILSDKVYPITLNISLKLIEKIFDFLSFLQQFMITNLSSYSVAISKYSKNELWKIYKKNAPVIYLGAISKTLKNE